jgi:hypothetical protein
MSKRNKILVPCGVIAILIISLAITIVNDGSWTASEMVAIHVVIDNRTNSKIGPFTLANSRGTTTVHVDAISPFSRGNVLFKMSESWGENAIVLTDEDERNYFVVPYFENRQKGRVDIRVDCSSSIGLAGVYRSLVSWYFSFEWSQWGYKDCYMSGN